MGYGAGLSDRWVGLSWDWVTEAMGRDCERGRGMGDGAGLSWDWVMGTLGGCGGGAWAMGRG